MTAPANPGGRARAGYRVTRRYGVPHADIAFLLNIEEKTYLRRLRQSGLDPDADESAGQLPDIEEILANIRGELVRLTEGGRVPDKAAVDALVSLARALKTLIELTPEKARRPFAEAAGVAVTPEEISEALARIDRRIDELANLRADEIIRRRFERGDGAGADEGVVLRGA
ncbi:hypothetical protein ATN84_00315 [Paramesorhizobium deserti]|uniref:Uncharacterized protein n=1 Tax=Paramesorhizobium deserti TaxID=1494590 RepID=A0A135HYL4_9HYPH|nr:hypothetical protein [Paramesorhizobium deserti]KXF78285.1 hypothetical protein ATN84_00315 [Paramesorhizobium deserti]